MSDDHEIDWNWAEQKADTELSIEEVRKESGLDERALITLDLEFLPEDKDADAAAFMKALESFGYLASAAENDPDGRIDATVLDIPFTLEAIWLHEERTTKLALARGFVPDGWGFWEP
ncbi:hypothetical protein [Amaricoccus sp.]|uniref:hypothetical protein n=1 Tax=Amaricoccus sp. TaxID=1872485 RepID=UPI0026185CFD|nr:hypothetical protein [uncultured Amaricoccus sp.]